MIRARAGERRQGFDRIETVHTVGALGPAPPSEVARVPQAARSATEEVGIEREDHVGAIEAVLRLDVIAECELRAGAGVLTARRIPLMPLCRGEAREQIANLRSERRRVDRFGQDPQPRTPGRLLPR